MWKASLLLGLLALPCASLRARPRTRQAAAGRAESGATRKPFHDELTAYKRQVSDAVGRRWYQAMKAHADEIAVGRVKVRFYLLPSGTIKNVQVIEGLKQHPALAKQSVGALQVTKFPPMPSAVRAALPKDSTEIDFSFENK